MVRSAADKSSTSAATGPRCEISSRQTRGLGLGRKKVVLFERNVCKLSSKQKLPDPNQSSDEGFVPVARSVQQYAGGHLVFHYPRRYTDCLWTQISDGVQKFSSRSDSSLLPSSDPRCNSASALNFNQS